MKYSWAWIDSDGKVSSSTPDCPESIWNYSVAEMRRCYRLIINTERLVVGFPPDFTGWPHPTSCALLIHWINP